MNTFTLYIYKADKRYKQGERLVSTSVWQHRDAAGMRREVSELQCELYPPELGFRMEYHPILKLVA